MKLFDGNLKLIKRAVLISKPVVNSFTLLVLTVSLYSLVLTSSDSCVRWVNSAQALQLITADFHSCTYYMAG